MRLGVVLISLLIVQVFLNCGFFATAPAQSSPDVFVGVDVAYGGVAEAKAVISQVSSYTNLIVIGTDTIVLNATELNETFQYAYNKGLYFMSLVPLLGRVNKTEWFEYANQTWGDHLLGIYAYDEPAGRQLDQAPPIGHYENLINNATTNNYVEAANQFENNMSSELNTVRSTYLNSTSYPLVTSDYALYWFDYKAGYNVVFAEFGWNNSRQLNVALDRGAATVQDKDWGAMITWTYTNPPYIESGPQLLDDMKLAYDNGAKYIIIFDSNANYTQGILQPEHLKALQQFWKYVQANPRSSNPVSARTAYVLPDGFGYGFREPNDTIWGIWGANTLSYNTSVSIGSLLQEYGTKLDIIYDDGLQPGNNYGYNQLIYWNSYNPPPSPSPLASPTPTQTLTSTRALMYYVAVIAVVAVSVLVLRKRQTRKWIK